MSNSRDSLKGLIATLSSSLMTLGLVATLATAFSPVSSSARPTTPARQQGFIEIEPGRSLYVDYQPAEPGKPTVMLLNGLTYRTGIWENYVRQYNAGSSGHGILRFDPVGQGQTLLRDGAPKGAIELDAQVRDMRLLLSALGLEKDVALVGISYGGALGAAFAARYGKSNPGLVQSLTMMAPFTEPMASQDQLIQTRIRTHRVFYPTDKRSDDELYDYYLRQIVYSDYWRTEPIVLEYPTKLEATFRLAQGVRRFRFSDIAHLLEGIPVHMVIALNDQYIPKAVTESAWSLVPTSAKGSLLYIFPSEHKIVEVRPHISAVWTELIVKKDPRLTGGRDWSVGIPLGLIDDRFRSFDGSDVIVPRSMFEKRQDRITVSGGFSCQLAFSN